MFQPCFCLGFDSLFLQALDPDWFESSWEHMKMLHLFTYPQRQGKDNTYLSGGFEL